MSVQIPPTCLRVFALPFVLALLVGGCSFVPALEQPSADVTLPEAFDVARPDTLRPMPQWWNVYNDPVLEQLVDTALVRNLDLSVAAARVVEVQNQYRIARAAQYPSLGIGGEVGRSDTPANVGFTSDLPAQTLPERFDNNTYTVSGTLAFERDLWGRVRSQKAAALSEFRATQEDYRTVQIGVVSEVIATYFELLDLEAQLRLTQAQLQLLTERAELTEERYTQGLVASFELYAVRQEFENTRTNVPLLEASISDARGRLAIVLGLYPAEAAALLASDRTPDLVLSPVPAGLPSDLLKERPDVAASMQRLEATRQNVGVARANLFPSVTMTVSGGLQSGELSALVNTGQYFTNLVTSLSAPLFQGGKLRANVRVSEAQYQQAIASYEKTLRTAFKEVEVTLTSLEKQRERYDVLLSERAYATASLDAQEARYREGIGDYVAYLDARRNLIRVETSLASAERALADARLAVHRALGGAWIETPDA